MKNEPEADIFGKLVFFGKNTELRAMIDCGFDINKVNSNGWRTLMMSVEGDQSKTLELLLKKGANPNIQTEADGFTALHLAVDCAMDGMIQNKRNQLFPEPLECIRILLKYGADKNIKNNSGKTPLDLYPVTKEILVEFEAA